MHECASGMPELPFRDLNPSTLRASWESHYRRCARVWALSYLMVCYMWSAEFGLPRSLRCWAVAWGGIHEFRSGVAYDCAHFIRDCPDRSQRHPGPGFSGCPTGCRCGVCRGCSTVSPAGCGISRACRPLLGGRGLLSCCPVSGRRLMFIHRGLRGGWQESAGRRVDCGDTQRRRRLVPPGDTLGREGSQRPVLRLGERLRRGWGGYGRPRRDHCEQGRRLQVGRPAVAWRCQRSR
jgi:hypothetical protein